MDYTTKEETEEKLEEYGEIPIAFEVKSKLRVELIEDGLGGIRLTEEAVFPPYIKSYDEDVGEAPSRWRERWDLSNWGFISAFEGVHRVGVAVVAYKTPGVNFLEESTDLAALWDIRVRPDYRGKGIGKLLFRNVENWAKSRECALLKVETQNINVPACRFYAAQGCKLCIFHKYAYPDYPDEVQLVWYKDLRK